MGETDRCVERHRDRQTHDRADRKIDEGQMTEVGGNCLDKLTQHVPCRTITIQLW